MVFDNLLLPPITLAAINPLVVVGLVVLVGGLGFGAYWLLTRRIT
jgi:hypothetical protein